MSKFYEYWEIPSEPHLKRIMETLLTKDSVQEKIAYLSTEVARFKQKGLAVGEKYPPKVEYAMKWSEVEIVRLREFKDLEVPNLITKKPKEENPKNKEFTTTRQVLAIRYLLDYCQVKNIDQTEIARFIEFLTGKNYKDIYDKTRDKTLQYIKNGDDARFVQNYFRRLGLRKIAEDIENELTSKKT